MSKKINRLSKKEIFNVKKTNEQYPYVKKLLSKIITKTIQIKTNRLPKTITLMSKLKQKIILN